MLKQLIRRYGYGSLILLLGACSWQTTQTPDYHVVFKTPLDEGYYVRIGIDNSGDWQLLQISDSRLQRQQNHEEVLYIGKSFDHIQPSFDAANVTGPTRFVCQLKKNAKVNRYTPCTSQLTVLEKATAKTKKVLYTTLTLGINLLFSDDNNEVKGELNTKKIRAMVAMIGLIAKVKDYAANQRTLLASSTCQTMATALTKFKEKILVEPVITDNSGFHRQQNLLQVTKVSTDACPQDLATSEVTVKWHPLPFTPFQFSATPSQKIVTYNAAKTRLSPNIVITGKRFHTFYPRHAFQNTDIKVSMREINAHSGRIRFYPIFINRTDHYLTITTMSLYVGNQLLSHQFAEKIVVPPRSKTAEHKIAIAREHVGELAYDALYGLINRTLTRPQAVKLQLSVGVSVKYFVDDHARTLFKKRKIPFLTLVGLQ